MMRLLLACYLSILSLSAMALGLDKRTETALGYLRQGYLQYGYEELKKAAAMNSLSAQFYVAVCYEQGIVVEKSMNEAFKMYRKAAERGLPDAMYHMASFYRNGIVVTQDSSREQEWLQRFNQKGGRMLLPDILPVYNEGVKHPENYALNPHQPTNKPSNPVANNPKNSIQQQPAPIVAQQVPAPAEKPKAQPVQPPVTQKKKADVDINIPVERQRQENMFALIIANENYQEVSKVPNALNDGAVFAEYCEKTIGIPRNNIKLVQDATLNRMRRQVKWLTQVMEAYQGTASVIFYYAGHGIPDESSRAAYLLPVDGYGNDVSTGYSLDEVYAELGQNPAKSVVVLLDACFSGASRDGAMLASARGVAIKAKQNAPKGNMVVMSAAQGDETAYPYKEKEHGMFTYYLLKKLQESQGDVTFGELADYVTSEVKKQSIIINGKMQTPVVSASATLSDSWKSMKLK